MAGEKGVEVRQGCECESEGIRIDLQLYCFFIS